MFFTFGLNFVGAIFVLSNQPNFTLFQNGRTSGVNIATNSYFFIILDYIVYLFTFEAIFVVNII